MNIIEDITSCLNEIYGHVVGSTTVNNFLSTNDEKVKRHFQNCKSLYDLNRKLGEDDKDCLVELYLGGLHTEQIWQQIELVNNWWPKHLLQVIKDEKKAKKKLKVSKEITEKENLLVGEEEDNLNGDDNDEILEKITKKVRFADEIDDDDKEKEGFEFEDEDDELEDENDDDNDDGEEESDTERSPKKARLELEDENNPFEMFKEALKKSKSQNNNETSHKEEKASKKATSLVDDRFFKLSKMEAFLDKQDAMEQKKIDKNDAEDPYGDYDDDNDDDDLDDEAAASMKYDDFFDQPEEDEIEFVEEDMMEVDGSIRELVPETDPKKLSSFEKRQVMMKDKIADLEDKSLQEKPWNLTGEVTALDRPANSLLKEQLDYNTASKPAALITEEITKSIEEKIIQRLISKVWDGPKRKVKTKEAAFNLKKKVILDQDKSKLSLEQIYENQYLEQSEKKEEKLPVDIEEIHQMQTSLFRKLDALTNFNYNPKPAIPDIEIISNEPVLNMEEVAPVAVSDAMALAPEEILDKNRRGLLGKTEMSKTDKKRSLRLKKKKQHFKRLDQENREKIKKLKAEKKEMLKSKTDDELKTDRKVNKRGKKKSKSSRKK